MLWTWVLSSVLSVAAVIHIEILWFYTKYTDQRVLVHSIFFIILCSFLLSLALLLWLCRIPPRTFGLTTIGILILFHIQHVINHLYQRSALTKYVREYALFWCIMGASLAGCFLLLPPRLATRPIMNPWWLVLTIGVIVIGTRYIIRLHWSRRSDDIQSTNRPEGTDLEMYFRLLKNINVLEEYYFIRRFHPKFKEKGRRPVLTEEYCQHFTSQTDTSTLPDPGQVLYKNNLKEFNILPNDSGYIAEDGAQVDIALRGTQEPSQMARNLGGMTPIYSDSDKIYKHAQMNSSAHAILDSIKPIIDSSDNLPINITGHSRGATIAFYLTQLIAREGSQKDRKINLVMFAPPPIIDPKAQNWLDNHKNVNVHTVYTKNDEMLLAHTYSPDTIGTLGTRVILEKTPESFQKPFCYLDFIPPNKWKSDKTTEFKLDCSPFNYKKILKSDKKKKPNCFPHRVDYYYAALSDLIRQPPVAA